MNKSAILTIIASLSTACGQNSKDEQPVTKTTPAQGTSIAIMRAPIGPDGEPDLTRAELRTGIAPSELGDGSLQEAFTSLGQSTPSKAINSEDELDRSSSADSWFLLPWRARVAAGLPVRSGPYLLPWRAAVANGYPVGGNYLLPFRQAVSNSQGYYSYNCNGGGYGGGYGGY